MVMSRENDRQPDLFGSSQGDLFAKQPAPPQTHDFPVMARTRLRAILAQMRAADRMPWDEPNERMYRTIVPQMTNWLPAEEADRVKVEFAAELARLTAA